MNDASYLPHSCGSGPNTTSAITDQSTIYSALHAYAYWLTRGACSLGRICACLCAYLALMCLGAILWHPCIASFVALAPAFLACIVDARILKLPNPLLVASIPGVACVVAWDAWHGGTATIIGHLSAGIVAAALSLLAHYCLRFGAGDVKLAALLGLFLITPLEGAALFFFAVLGAGIYASVRSLFLWCMLTFSFPSSSRGRFGGRIAFGPWLFTAMVVISLARWAAWAPAILS